MTQLITQTEIENKFKTDYEFDLLGAWKSMDDKITLHFLPMELARQFDGIRRFALSEYPDGYYVTTNYKTKEAFVHFNKEQHKVTISKKDKPKEMSLLYENGNRISFREIL